MSNLKKKQKAIIDDGCCPDLVRGADFDLPLGIPIIKSPEIIEIPETIIPFSERNHTNFYHAAVGFNENDIEFAEVLRNPMGFLDDFSRFDFLISPDCSMYRDAPIAVQLINVYRNRAIGSYYQRNGLNVIPQVRWGNEYTYSKKYFPEPIAFLGVEKKSIVAIGTYGCSRSKEDKFYFEAGLGAMMETIEPSVVLVYGSMSKVVFDNYLNYASFVHYTDWIAQHHIQKQV